ncbi:EF-hand calcium-binding domain-containing protein 4A isoform X4 [Rhineura floridana]|uniref:EF-hand calcium-binding domain-containing protein 4A isoform X4 n=1 Tax=Rhineura floridana TaxID=261503 RepID=UPI002AC82707|nr:EF-hand calcium-binding domain-containing protein 4A isoform X4 [Rhineura floridana]
MALLSLVPVGLKKLMRRLHELCVIEGLKINYKKTKVLVFGRRYVNHRWSMDNHQLEQTRVFKYLGVIFSDTLSWKTHLQYTKQSAIKTVGAILKFHRSTGGNLVTPALKIFEAKVIPQVLYGALIWGWDTKAISSLETIQTDFLRRLLNLPPGTSSAMLRAETGLPPLTTHIHLALLRFMRSTVHLQNKDLLNLYLTHSSTQKSWGARLENLLHRYHLTIHQFNTIGSDKKLREAVIHHSQYLDRLYLLNSRSAPWYWRFKTDHSRSPYLTTYMPSNLRFAFTSLRFFSLPNAEREGRIAKVPKEQRYCICGYQGVEDLPHILLDCPIYHNPRMNLTSRWPDLNESAQLPIKYYS